MHQHWNFFLCLLGVLSFLISTLLRKCKNLKSFNINIKVQITPEEVKAGLKLAPLEHEVEVKPSPTKDIVFSQMRAKVQGNIKCLEICRPMQLSITSIGRSEGRNLVQVYWMYYHILDQYQYYLWYRKISKCFPQVV